jgi:hypothetical protein
MSVPLLQSCCRYFSYNKRSLATRRWSFILIVLAVNSRADQELRCLYGSKGSATATIAIRMYIAAHMEIGTTVLGLAY